MRKKAVVAGALGVSGRALVNHLVALGDWEVIGLSRRRPEFQTPVRYIAIDLLNRADVDRIMGEIRDVTHVFYAALQPRDTFFDEVMPNLRMLQHTVEAVEQSSAQLRKVVLIEGAKYYGAHLGPYKTPAKENDPRHMPPNFYYDQEDYLVSRSRGKEWSWTALRPSCICGFAVGNPMNMATVIAVYAAICRELGLPLRYPGSAVAYGMLMEMTDAELLAKAMVWAGENERCDGQAFNITNGDFSGGFISGRDWRTSSAWRWLRRNDFRSQASCPTRSRSGERPSRNTACSITRSRMLPRGRSAKRFSIWNMT
jgi:nucleoside-diphosphate-sugar epimerase